MLATIPTAAIRQRSLDRPHFRLKGAVNRNLRIQKIDGELRRLLGSSLRSGPVAVPSTVGAGFRDQPVILPQSNTQRDRIAGNVIPAQAGIQAWPLQRPVPAGFPLSRE
jgi:hypothetical protein